MTNKCSSCKYFTLNKIQKTIKEGIISDKPKPIGFIQNIHSWFSSKYDTIYYDSFDKIEDHFIKLNNNSGVCSRYPKSVLVSKDYLCAEYKYTYSFSNTKA